MELERQGRIARILINNNRRNKTTNKDELTDALGIRTSELKRLLVQTQEYLGQFGLEMVGVSVGKTSDFLFSDRLFVRNRLPSCTGRASDADDRALFFLLAVVQLENNNLNEEKLQNLKRSNLFRETTALDYLKGYRTLGYFASKRKDEVVIWSYGWRFYVEFGEGFDIVKHHRQTPFF